MLKKSLVVINKLGLHARAAAKIVNEANHYTCKISIVFNNKKADAKSIMDVMMLAARKDSIIEISADGEDETIAIQALELLIINKFGEPE